MVSSSIAIAIAILSCAAGVGAASTVVLLSWLREERYRTEELGDRLKETTDTLNREIRQEGLTLHHLIDRYLPRPPAQTP